MQIKDFERNQGLKELMQKLVKKLFLKRVFKGPQKVPVISMTYYKSTWGGHLFIFLLLEMRQT